MLCWSSQLTMMPTKCRLYSHTLTVLPFQLQPMQRNSLVFTSGKNKNWDYLLFLLQESTKIQFSSRKTVAMGLAIGLKELSLASLKNKLSATGFLSSPVTRIWEQEKRTTMQHDFLFPAIRLYFGCSKQHKDFWEVFCHVTIIHWRQKVIMKNASSSSCSAMKRESFVTLGDESRASSFWGYCGIGLYWRCHLAASGQGHDVNVFFCSFSDGFSR